LDSSSTIDRNFGFSFPRFLSFMSRVLHMPTCNVTCCVTRQQKFFKNKEYIQIVKLYVYTPGILYLPFYTRMFYTITHMCTGVQFTSSRLPVLCAHTCNHFQPHICPHICHPVALPNHHYNNVEHTYMPSPKHLHVPRQLPANW
jgi:hypothetical protein